MLGDLSESSRLIDSDPARTCQELENILGALGKTELGLENPGLRKLDTSPGGALEAKQKRFGLLEGLSRPRLLDARHGLVQGLRPDL